MKGVVLTEGTADVALRLPDGRLKPLGIAGEGTYLPEPDTQIAIALHDKAVTQEADRFPSEFVRGHPAQAWLALLGDAAADEGPLAAEEIEARTRLRLQALLASDSDATERDARHSAQSQERMRRTVGDFARLLEGRFRRHDPRDADRSPIARAARLAATHLGLKPGEIEPAEGERDEAFLERFAAASGARLRRISLESLDELEGEGPIVAFAADGAPVVLLPGRLAGMTAIDPVTMGPMRMGKAAGPLAAQGFALHPVLPAGKLTYRSLLAFGLVPCIPGLLSVALAGFIESLASLALPIAFGFMANIIIPTDNLPLLALLCGGLLVVLAVQTAVHVTGQFARVQVEGRADMTLHAAMVDRVLRLPLPVLRQSSTAILATQTETVASFRRSVLDYAIAFVLAAMHGLLVAGLLCFYSPAAGLVAIAAVVVLLLVTALIGRLQFTAIYEGERMDVVVLTFVYDLIRLVPVLQAQRAERQAFVQWAQNYMAFQSRLVRSMRIGNWLGVFQGAWEVLTLALVFVAMAWVGIGGAFATGTAVAFVIALGRLNGASLGASQAMIGIAKLMPMAKLARSLIEQTLPPQSSGTAVAELRGDVTLARVSFAYGTRPVLENASLQIKAGEFIGICGRSGEGKSTLLRLMLGLDAPASGAVLIDGLDVRSLDQAGLARQIGVVLQNGQLWAGTIFENMRGGSDLSLQEAEALAERVGLAPDLAAMPMGLQTIIGEGGLGLASGQVQRILIARALAGNPRLLVLDEPVGALRGRDRAHIEALLAGLEITRIVVSHDPTLLAGASRVLRLERGALKALRGKE